VVLGEEHVVRGVAVERRIEVDEVDGVVGDVVLLTLWLAGWTISSHSLDRICRVRTGLGLKAAGRPPRGEVEET
jgi:hypothetical protein